MLTRIEIDGFKSFEEFKLDFQPFTVIFGANATGKSNLFDALRLLSRLASMDIASAFAGSENGRDGDAPRGDPIEQFRMLSTGPTSRIRIAVEVLLPRHVRDPHGGSTMLSQTRIRYAITIERRETPSGERLLVSHEEAGPISSGEDRWTPGGKELPSEFRKGFVLRQRQKPFIATEENGNRVEIKLHQDGRQGRTRSADSVSATMLSSITTTDYPHLYALREELRSIHFLHFVPDALRAPSPVMAPDLLTSDGRNLASVLARIERETKNDVYPHGALTDIRNAMATLVPGIADVHVRYDKTERRQRIELATTSGLTLSARVASDGTLRMLALVSMLNDPRRPGVICFEEPENGIHKLQLVLLITMLRQSCTDPSQDRSPDDEPLRQIILNTHSPVVAKSLVPFKHDIVVAQTKLRLADGHQERVTAMATHQTVRQGNLAVGDVPRPLSDYELEQLTEIDDAQVT